MFDFVGSLFTFAYMRHLLSFILFFWVGQRNHTAITWNISIYVPFYICAMIYICYVAYLFIRYNWFISLINFRDTGRLAEPGHYEIVLICHIWISNHMPSKVWD